MNDDTILGGVLNQLGQTAKKTVQQVVKLPEEMAKDVGGQVGGAPQRPGFEGQVKPAASTESSGEPKEEKKPQPQWQSDEERVKFLRDLYGKKDMSQRGASEKKPTELEEQIRDKSPEEQKKLMELRSQLHKENYYDPTFNPKNPPAGGEERPAEKVEKEKKQEMQELQKKEEENPPPLAVRRAAQRVENLPNAG